MPTENPGARPEPRTHLGNAAALAAREFIPIDPLKKSQLASYSLQPNVVPNYVLAQLAAAHHRQLNGTLPTAPHASHLRAQSAALSDRDAEYTSFMNDPFNKTLGHGYADLLDALRLPREFVGDEVSLDHSLGQSPLLDGPWGGDDRLRQAIMGTSAGDYVARSESRRGFLVHFLPRSGAGADDAPRLRYKAGYWMLDEKRRDLAPRLQRLFVINPLVPLFLRILMLIFSSCSLGLAVTVFTNLRQTFNNIQIPQQPGTVFAIVVQSFAIVYIVYIAYDEYSGKPLGLRDPLGKLKLIMLDVLFIIFCSADLSLAYSSLFDTGWVCRAQPGPGANRITVGFLCRQQRALVFFLLMVVFLWLLTFAISIIRVVDRVSSTPRRT
ncbi:hypothetical protein METBISCDRAFT_14618 [Metschnikowia bicuspidata]|uniref:Regulator of phospholipase D SRF1 n=1 Tax=Metschnikowia bicuspidata TaxID=27322 RepID=A0A4P9ZEF7_9ASCO|nr:hypothetical protein METBISCDRAFT_14618 [Metschnikowia bicuspidata]